AEAVPTRLSSIGLYPAGRTWLARGLLRAAARRKQPSSITSPVPFGADLVGPLQRLEHRLDQPLSPKRHRTLFRFVSTFAFSTCHSDSSLGPSENRANLVPNTIGKGWVGGVD